MYACVVFNGIFCGGTTECRNIIKQYIPNFISHVCTCCQLDMSHYCDNFTKREHKALTNTIIPHTIEKIAKIKQQWGFALLKRWQHQHIPSAHGA